MSCSWFSENILVNYSCINRFNERKFRKCDFYENVLLEARFASNPVASAFRKRYFEQILVQIYDSQLCQCLASHWLVSRRNAGTKVVLVRTYISCSWNKIVLLCPWRKLISTVRLLRIQQYTTRRNFNYQTNLSLT